MESPLNDHSITERYQRKTSSLGNGDEPEKKVVYIFCTKDVPNNLPNTVPQLWVILYIPVAVNMDFFCTIKPVMLASKQIFDGETGR
jgi:hypothetical protein